MRKGRASKIIPLIAVAVGTVYLIKLITYTVLIAAAITIIYFAIRALL
jgi:hypothetical protein